MIYLNTKNNDKVVIIKEINKNNSLVRVLSNNKKYIAETKNLKPAFKKES